ncbi:MAG TPA: hypothetical protein VNH18_21590 [Bryobacteraceae bacterium]|nr:hypothetical protein [Bryobacteraceae bacterium]
MELVYIENYLGVATVNGGQTSERHGLIFTESPVQKLDEWTYEKMLLYTNNRRKSRSLADRIARYVKPEKWRSPEAEDARNDLLDPEFANACARAAVPHLTRGYVPPEDAYFAVKLDPGSAIESRGIQFDMSIETNFDFDVANTLYQRYVPNAKFDKASLMVGVFAALADLRTTARFSDEMAVSPAGFVVAKMKLARLLSKRHQSAEQVQAFQEWTCEDGRAIREAVNAKHKNFDDVLRLVEAAGRFKDWLAQREESADLRKAYLQAVSRSSWGEKLPNKVLRFLLFNAAGAALGHVQTPVAAAAGFGLSILDSFYLDGLLKGWKPDQFIEGALREFIK